MRTVKRRAPGDCPAGQQYYVCNANSFVGCCTVDACDLAYCPDAPSSLTSSSIPKTSSLTVSSTASSNTLSSTSSVQSSYTTTSPPSSTSSSASPSSTSTSILVDAGLPGSISALIPSTTGLATSSPTPIPTNSSSSKSSTTPIVAGVVSGSIFLLIMALASWFCFRRRKQVNEKSHKTISQYGTPGNDFILSRPTISEPRRHDDVFAPFGGVYHSRSSSRSEQHQQMPAILPTSPPPHVSHAHKPQQQRSLSHTQTPSQATLRSLASEAAQAQAEAISACSPEIPKTPPRDPEKAALAPPPEHEHPIYGFTAHPGTLVNPNLEPIPSIDSSLQNPAKLFHGREPKYRSLLRRTSEVTRNTTTSRRHQLWGTSQYTDDQDQTQSQNGSMGPSPATTFDSPVPGVSELEGEGIQSPLMKNYEEPIVPGHIELEAGEVPERYLSPPIPSKSVKRCRDSVIIPVGLGFGAGLDPVTPTSIYPHTPDSEFFPHTVTDAPQVPSLKSRFNQPAQDVKGPNLFAAAREVLDGSGKEVVSPLSPEMQRWSGITAIASRGGTPADLHADFMKRRREDLVPLSGVSVDVEREWGSWALR